MGETWLFWSSGKDSAWALEMMRRVGDRPVTRLLTTLRKGDGRIAIHEVSRDLVSAQADAAGLPLDCIELPADASNTDYEAALAPIFEEAKRARAALAFGDLHLADIRAYRESLLGAHGLEGRFPLWGRDPGALAREMLDGGLRATVACVDLAALDRSFVGLPYDAGFLERLPTHVDPCGEQGEFHTFVWDGPMFHRRIDVRVRDTRSAGPFAVADLELGAP